MKTLKITGFWFLSFTWGLIMTIPGVVCAVILLCTGHKPKLFRFLVYFETKREFSGFSLGPFIVCGQNPAERVLLHEAGHSLQNIIYGPFMPFVVSIPSFIRYHYRRYIVKSGRKTESQLPVYNNIWFERQANELGVKLKDFGKGYIK